jgi:hypothetical protein
MAMRSNRTDPERDGSPRVGVGTFFFIVAMVVLFFILGQSMVQHRFFWGGRYYHGRLSQ